MAKRKIVELLPRARHDISFSRDRKEGIREPRDRILIVCEGEKTEPGYFEALIKALGLDENYITILPSDSAPSSIFKTALNNSKRYNHIYCVFDREDEHTGPTTYEQTLEDLKKENKKRKQQADEKIFYAINSVPSFEVWILLHFTFTTAELKNADAARKEIKKFKNKYGALAAFKKEITPEIFACLHPKYTDIAIKHAEKLLQEHTKSQGNNPSTNVHLLVQKLKDMPRKF